MPWANHAEKYLNIFYKSIAKEFKAFNAPLVLWCYCAECRSKIINYTTHEKYHLNGQTSYTSMTVQPTDISAICEIGWYNWLYYQDPYAKLPRPVEHLGRVLGPAEHARKSMS